MQGHRQITWVAALIVVSVLLAACRPAGGSGSPATSPLPSAATIELRGSVTAGPTCPVERDPPDPSCAPRAVPGATVTIQDAAGSEIERAVSDSRGRFTVALAPGRYRLIPQPIGQIEHAPPVEVDVRTGEQPPEVDIGYDTGIR